MWTFGTSWNGLHLVQGWNGFHLIQSMGCMRVGPPTTPMDPVLLEIDKAIGARLYYLAVVMALTLPDICAAVEAENGRTHPDKYKAWYRQHFAAYYPQLTDEDCYELRCGVVHQGRFGRRPDNPKLQYARVVFSLPSPIGGVVVSLVAENVLNLDVAHLPLLVQLRALMASLPTLSAFR